MLHLWGVYAEFDNVVNRTGTLGPNRPVFTATDGFGPSSCKVSCASSEGATRGLPSVLHRHTRLQDASSIDLTYSVQELDQGL